MFGGAQIISNGAGIKPVLFGVCLLGAALKVLFWLASFMLPLF